MPLDVLEGARVEQEEEVVVPLAREEAVPTTVAREVERVRLRKVVRTEMKHFDIPVRREELVVERVPVGPETPVDAGPVREGAAPVFEGESFIIPLYEEQVEFTKVAREWEEVEVSRDAQVEAREVRTRLRRERADVEERGEVPHGGPPEGPHA
ncbi:DUF2382 domain-containing protein [Myxococcaceae bacterium GXIMD 01537]